MDRARSLPRTLHSRILMMNPFLPSFKRSKVRLRMFWRVHATVVFLLVYGMIWTLYMLIK